MISRRLLAFFHGYVVAMVQGRGSEALMNQALAAGVTFWDVQRKAPEIIIFKLQAAAYPRLRPYFWRTRTRGKILRRRGWPFFGSASSGKRVGSSLLFLFTLHFFSAFIWFVEITGAKTIEEARIRQHLTELGLKPGLAAGDCAEKGLAHQGTTDAPPEAVWVSLDLQGVVSRR